MRYFNPELKDVQSTFVPTELPWEMMLKGLAMKQADFDKQAVDVEAKKNAFDLPTSLYIDNERTKAISEPYKKQYEEIANNFYNTGNATETSKRLTNLHSKFTSLPEVRNAYKQAEINKLTEPERLKDPNAVTPYYANGKVKQLPDGVNPLNWSEAEVNRAYGLTKTGNWEQEINPYLSKFRDEVVSDPSKYAPQGYDVFTDTKSGLLMMRDSKGHELEYQIDPVKAWNNIQNYAYSTFDNTDMQSILHEKVKSEYNNKPFTADDFAAKIYNTALPMFGVHNIQDNRDYNYSIVPGQTGNGDNPNKKPTNTKRAVYTEAAVPTQQGVDDVADMKQKLTGRVVSKSEPIDATQVVGGLAPVQQIAVNRPTKWNDFNDQQKNYIKQWYKSKGFNSVVENIDSGKDMNYLFDTKNVTYNLPAMQKEMEKDGYFERIKGQTVRTNNYTSDLSYDSEDVYNEIGLRNSKDSPATLGNLAATQLFKGDLKWYKITDDNKVEYVDIKKEYPNINTSEGAADAKNIYVGAGRYKPENNFKLTIGTGDSWGNALSIKIGNDEYVVQSPRYESIHPNPVIKAEENERFKREHDRNNHINDIYQDLNFGVKGAKRDVIQLNGTKTAITKDPNGYKDNNGYVYESLEDAMDGENGYKPTGKK
jgi:hypothetical protein